MMPRSRRFSLSALALAAALVAAVPAPAPARAIRAADQPGPGSLQTSAAGFSFALDASVGVVEGTARELVFYYPNGRKFKLSELTWDLKDVVMAGVHGSVGYGRWLRLNLGVRSALTEGSGMMVDRDWDYAPGSAVFIEPSDRNWTHESRHPDTSVDKGTVVDLNLSVLALPAGPFSLRGILGYRRDTWNWSARGGTYIYSDESLRDTTGTFPPGREVITYEQHYSIPYIGVGASWVWPAFQIESRLLYSPLVSASDLDDHVLRSVIFEGEFSKGTYLGLGLNATWLFASHWAATLGAEYQTIPEIVGDFTKAGAEGYGVYRNGGGVAMNALSLTLGAGYRF